MLPAHTTGGSSLTAAAALASLPAAASFTAAITAAASLTAAITAAASLDGSETKFGWEPPHLRRRG